MNEKWGCELTCWVGKWRLMSWDRGYSGRVINGSPGEVVVSQSCPTLCDPMDCSTPGFPVLHHAQTHDHWISDAIQPSHPLPSPSPPAFNLSKHQGLHELALHIRWPKYWSFSISPSNEYSGLISFRIDWFDLAVRGTLKSLLQHHSSKASILQLSTFFIVQLSHPYITTGKTIALTIQTFVGKVMSLLFNNAVYVCHSFSSKEQPSFNFMAAITVCSDFGAQENKICHCYHCFPSTCCEVMRLDAMILVFWMLSLKPDFSLFSFTLINRFFSSSSLSAIGVMLSAYLRILILSPALLIPVYDSPSPECHMTYSECKLYKPGDSIQTWRAPFPIWDPSVVT